MHIWAKSKRNSNAFTIIELIVVMVIIGILVSVTVVAYGGITRQANDTATLAALKATAQSIEMELSDNPGYDTCG